MQDGQQIHVQLHGGMGLMSDLPFARFWRDAQSNLGWHFGIQRHIISRDLLRPLNGWEGDRSVASDLSILTPNCGCIGGGWLVIDQLQRSGFDGQLLFTRTADTSGIECITSIWICLL